MRACMHVCVCMYLCMHSCMYECMYVCIRLCMHACMHHFRIPPLGYQPFAPWSVRPAPREVVRAAKAATAAWTVHGTSRNAAAMLASRKTTNRPTERGHPYDKLSVGLRCVWLLLLLCFPCSLSFLLFVDAVAVALRGSCSLS